MTNKEPICLRLEPKDYSLCPLSGWLSKWQSTTISDAVCFCLIKAKSRLHIGFVEFLDELNRNDASSFSVTQFHGRLPNTQAKSELERWELEWEGYMTTILAYIQDDLQYLVLTNQWPTAFRLAFNVSLPVSLSLNLHCDCPAFLCQPGLEGELFVVSFNAPSATMFCTNQVWRVSWRITIQNPTIKSTCTLFWFNAQRVLGAQFTDFLVACCDSRVRDRSQSISSFAKPWNPSRHFAFYCVWVFMYHS